MAMDYEVRPEFRDIPLEELLESSVTCFQGVGDTQFDILQRFFSTTTVGDLANMPFFLSALGIQELALRPGGEADQPVAQVGENEELKFNIRPEYSDSSANQLLASPVRVLGDLTPAQALALYDGFRITTVIQLAQNRIMLEARIIEHLKKVAAGEIPEADMDGQISSILLSGVSAGSGGQGAVGEDSLGEMTDSLHSHLRDRIESLRSRAKEKAEDIAHRPESTRDELHEEAARLRPGEAPDTRSRADMIREMRDRGSAAGAGSEGGRTTVASSRASLMEEMRARRAAAEGGTTGARTATATRGPSTSASRPSTATRGAAAKAGTAAQAGTADAAAEAIAAGAVEEPRTRRQPQPARVNMPRVLIAAAALIVLLVGGIWIWISSTEPPARMTSEMQQASETASEPGAAGTASTAGTANTAGAAGQETATTDSGAASESDASAASAAGRSDSRGALSLPVRSIHTVTEGQSLWRISRRHYNNPELWPWIFRVNEGEIDDPDLIYPQQKLDIPEVP